VGVDENEGDGAADGVRNDGVEINIAEARAAEFARFKAAPPSVATRSGSENDMIATVATAPATNPVNRPHTR
jgi:hypothetical protein